MMATTAAHTGDKAEQLGDSKLLEVLARVGLVSYGLVHLLIGWSALQIAWGGTDGGSADSSGALTTLAARPFGRTLLGAVAVGLVALALWQTSVAIWGYRHSTGTARIREKATSAAKAVVYTTMGVSAASIALGAGSSSSQSQGRATSGVLGWSGGQAIVVIAGLVVVAVGVASAVKGACKSFREEIDTSAISPSWRAAVNRLGQIGYLAKGLALSIVGALLAYTAVTFDPAEAQGLDGAMEAILAQPFGSFLLTSVALGFMAFGAFAVLQSRYRRM